jgi:hypothetical protein
MRSNGNVTQPAPARAHNNTKENTMKTKLKQYTVTTDAVTTTVQAHDEDDAARFFSLREALYQGYNINGVADLVWAAKRMGGWANVIEQ